jgi:hypothetical protein
LIIGLWRRNSQVLLLAKWRQAGQNDFKGVVSDRAQFERKKQRWHYEVRFSTESFLGFLTMPASLTTPSVPCVQMPLMLVAEVQDSLLVVVHDLHRLDGLLAHTMENLMERFTAASANLANPELAASQELDVVRSTLRAAVTELQFQDMASQLISHTSKILQGCAYRLALESMGSEDGEAVPFVEEVPERPNPVTQDEMDAGSIELF